MNEEIKQIETQQIETLQQSAFTTMKKFYL